MEKILSPDVVIDALGGTSEVARICEIQPPSVSEWRRNGIPKAQLKFLRLARPEVFTRLETPPAHAGRQPASPHQIMDTIPCRAVVVAGGEKA